jgi:hypothetical protein
MAVLGFVTAEQQAQANTTNTLPTNARPTRPVVQANGQRQADPNRKQAKLWLNIGFHNGDKFVNLPVGIPLDTMEFIELKGQNQEWIDFQDDRNILLEALQTKGASLEPGTAEDIPGLIVQVRRVGEAQPSAAQATDRKARLDAVLNYLSPAPVSE